MSRLPRAIPTPTVEAMMERIRTMDRGETLTFVLLDATRYNEPIDGPDAEGSLRATVERDMDGEPEYTVVIEEWVNWSWRRYRLTERDGTSALAEVAAWFREPLEDAPAILAFFLLLAKRARIVMVKERQDWMYARKKAQEAETTQAEGTPPLDERGAFEAWYREMNEGNVLAPGFFDRDGDGDYESHDVFHMFEAWKARGAQEAAK